MTAYSVVLMLTVEAEVDVDVVEACNEACEALDRLFHPDSIQVRWERVQDDEENT